MKKLLLLAFSFIHLTMYSYTWISNPSHYGNIPSSIGDVFYIDSRIAKEKRYFHGKHGVFIDNKLVPGCEFDSNHQITGCRGIYVPNSNRSNSYAFIDELRHNNEQKREEYKRELSKEIAERKEEERKKQQQREELLREAQRQRQQLYMQQAYQNILLQSVLIEAATVAANIQSSQTPQPSFHENIKKAFVKSVHQKVRNHRKHDRNEKHKAKKAQRHSKHQSKKHTSRKSRHKSKHSKKTRTHKSKHSHRFAFIKSLFKSKKH